MEPFDLNRCPLLALTLGDASTPHIVDQITIDSRRIDKKNALFVALKGSNDGHDYVGHAAAAGVRYALVSREWKAPPLPGNTQLLRVDDPLKALQQIAKYYRMHLNVPTIGIIGSYGKTMVKDLLNKMLSETFNVAASPGSFNSQIGVPLSLLTIKKNDNFALIEAAFSKEDEMEVLADLINPANTVLTHMGRKHLTTLVNMETIAAECAHFLRLNAKAGWVLLPDDALLAPHSHQITGRKYFWNSPSSDLPHAYAEPITGATKVQYKVDFPDGATHQGNITSGFYYSIDLINMTSKAAWLMGVSSENIINVLRNFSPEPMRTEIWKSPIGTTFINDTYCSDPHSVDIALKHFDLAPKTHKKIFIFHGIKGAKDDEHHAFRRVGKAVKDASVSQMFLIGDHAYDPLVEEAGQSEMDIVQFPTLSHAYESLRATLQGDEVVLIKGDKKMHLDHVTEAFNDSITNNQCIINLAAIGSNINVIRKRLPPKTRLLVIVKALAYGTDDVRMANFLASCGIDILGVSFVDEGVSLRKCGIKTAIFIINAAVYEAAKVVKGDFEVGVSELQLIDALAREAGKAGKRIKVHLHVNTGMSRLGCRPEEALELAKVIMGMPSLILEGIMTHFASSESPQEDAFTLQQAATFTSVIEELRQHGIDPPWKHAASSSGILRFDFPQFNMARVGLAVYGLHASSITQENSDLRLAFSLVSRIVGINVCKSGETVSYGRSYTVHKEEQRIAVLPIGYFDGLHRNYSGKGSVIVRGHKAPMVGRITMDYMMVDVTDIPHAAIGDPVLLFGEDEYGHYVSPEEFAFAVGSIPHELITCLGPRIQRIFVYEESHEKKNSFGVTHGSLQQIT